MHRLQPRQLAGQMRYFTTTRRTSKPFLQPYITQLKSNYPSADVPSLVASFILLHELTAIVPLFAGFWACRVLGLGAGLVTWAATSQQDEPSSSNNPSWAKDKLRAWVQRGELKAQRIGMRYGVFGYDKETREQRQERRKVEAEGRDSTALTAAPRPSPSISSDAANLVAAYIGVKVSWPMPTFLNAARAQAFPSTAVAPIAHSRLTPISTSNGKCYCAKV